MVACGVMGRRNEAAKPADEKKPARTPVLFAEGDYWLAPEAGAAAEAPASLAAAAPEAAAGASEAAAGAEAAAAGAEAADVSLAAAGAALSSFLPQAAKAITANSDATRRDFFMITSFYGYR
jgi:hypothetical protein